MTKVKHPEVPADLLEALGRLHAMRLSEWIGEAAAPPALIEHDTPLAEVLRLLRTSEHLWVKDKKGRPIPAGVVTRRDVLSSLMSPRYRYTGLRSSMQTSILRGTADCASCYIMHKQAPVCGPEDTVADMVRTAVRSGETVVAVVEGERFLGEVGVADLMKKLLSLAGET